MLIGVVLALVCLSGCVFSKLEQDLRKLEGAAFPFKGTVGTEDLESRKVIVVAMTDTAGEHVVGFAMQYRSDNFEMLLPEQPTYFFAFNDLNQDFRFHSFSS